jgi:hypothetical protein
MMPNNNMGGFTSIFSNEQPTSNSLFSKNDPFSGNFGQEYQFTMKQTGFYAASSLGEVSATQHEKNLLLDMLNTSFINTPLLQDQVGIDISKTCPLPVEDSVFLAEDAEE